MGIEQGAKAMDEGDGTDPGGWARPRAKLAQAPLHRTEENMQRQGLHGRIGFQVVAQAFGHRQHPLTYRQPRHDVIGEIRCGLDHPPGIARGGHAAPLARECDQEVVLTVTPDCGQKTGLPPPISCPQAVIAARFWPFLRNSRHEIRV